MRAAPGAPAARMQAKWDADLFPHGGTVRFTSIVPASSRVTGQGRGAFLLWLPTRQVRPWRPESSRLSVRWNRLVFPVVVGFGLVSRWVMSFSRQKRSDIVFPGLLEPNRAVTHRPSGRPPHHPRDHHRAGLVVDAGEQLALGLSPAGLGTGGDRLLVHADRGGNRERRHPTRAAARRFPPPALAARHPPRDRGESPATAGT